jgi:hypothetical protein
MESYLVNPTHTSIGLFLVGLFNNDGHQCLSFSIRDNYRNPPSERRAYACSDWYVLMPNEYNKLILFVHLDNKTILGYEVIEQSDPAHEIEPIRTITLGESSEPHSTSMLIALMCTNYYFPMN